MQNHKKRYVDLTHTLSSQISVFPGQVPPQITPSATFQKQGYRALHLSIGTHHGTHIDSPAHFIPSSKCLDQFKPEHFLGKGIVIDLNQSQQQTTKQIQELKDIDFVFFWTGWDQYWKTNQYQSKFPVINQKMANILTEKSIRGVGVDTLSIDCITSTSFPNHKILLSSNVIIIQNLTNLHQLRNTKFDVICLPIKILNSDGAPARVIAIADETL